MMSECSKIKQKWRDVRRDGNLGAPTPPTWRDELFELEKILCAKERGFVNLACKAKKNKWFLPYLLWNTYHE
jgi:hypothetical protein